MGGPSLSPPGSELTGLWRERGAGAGQPGPVGSMVQLREEQAAPQQKMVIPGYSLAINHEGEVVQVQVFSGSKSVTP